MPRTKAFVAAIHQFVEREGVELVRFKKGERKDDVMQKKLRWFKKAGRTEAVLFVGVAQENAWIPRTTRKPLEGGGTTPAPRRLRRPGVRVQSPHWPATASPIVGDGIDNRALIDKPLARTDA